MWTSPALQVIGKMKDTLEGRTVGILIADGSDGAAINAAKKAVTGAGASVKVVAPKLGGTMLADGSTMASEAGMPSVLFDAIVVILSAAGAEALSKESCAIDFVRDAFGHLKAIGKDAGAGKLLKHAHVEDDGGVIDISDMKAFLSAAKTRQWDREVSVRTLA